MSHKKSVPGQASFPISQETMTSNTRTYTIPERNFLSHTGRGMWVGSIFQDHGRTMRITAVGPVYKDGRERLIDVTAVEIQKWVVALLLDQRTVQKAVRKP